jgi:TatD DNase family protein
VQESPGDSLLLDSHCHLDRYENPAEVAREAARRGVFTLAVTNLPSHFVVGAPHARDLPRVRLMLGLHPLTASDHPKERSIFREQFSRTTFIGEVGLDFSRAGEGTRDAQIESFRMVAELVLSDPLIRG